MSSMHHRHYFCSAGRAWTFSSSVEMPPSVYRGLVDAGGGAAAFLCGAPCGDVGTRLPSTDLVSLPSTRAPGLFHGPILGMESKADTKTIRTRMRILFNVELGCGASEATPAATAAAFS